MSRLASHIRLLHLVDSRPSLVLKFQPHRNSILSSSVRFTTMPSKRLKRESSSPSASTAKKAKKSKPNGSSSSDALRQPHHKANEAEENGIAIRKFYPPEMSNARARAYNENNIPRPIELLIDALEVTAKERKSIDINKAVVHWFKMDLRISTTEL